MRQQKFQTIPTSRIERWLGAEKTENLQASMRGWHGDPIHLVDVPGSVRITKDGDFVGPFDRGFYFSALDALESHLKTLSLGFRTLGPAMAHAGFTSISDALSRASQGYRQRAHGGMIQKTGTTGVTGGNQSLWRVGAMPAAGAAGGSAPGGTAWSNASTGAMGLVNPAVGTMRLTGADFTSSLVNATLLIYDRLFSVTKTMNSTGTEAVTGVPTRFQSTNPASEDYASGNFLSIEVDTVLPATAHNWTVCTYTDQDGNTGATLPSVTGVSAAAVNNLDQPTGGWFCPLASGDSGILALTQMQCSALVATGAISFVIGHPIGFCVFPVINTMFPFDWLTNRDLAPYIPNSACLSLYDITRPTTTAATFVGSIYVTSTGA